MTQENELEQSILDLLNALDVKEQKKALRSAMRKEGNRLKKKAGSILSAKGLRHGSDVAKSLRVRVYPDKYGAGFMVTAKPRGKQGYHKNARGKEKPIAMWAEEGTNARYKRNKKKSRTGSMGAYRFLADTQARSAGEVENTLWADFQKNLDKALKKKNLL